MFLVLQKYFVKLKNFFYEIFVNNTEKNTDIL